MSRAVLFLILALVPVIIGPRPAEVTDYAEADVFPGEPGQHVLAGAVHGWSDDNNYWVGGAEFWREVPTGETEEKTAVKYVIGRVASGVYSQLAAAATTIYLDVEVENVTFRLKNDGATLSLVTVSDDVETEQLSVDSGVPTFDAGNAGLYAQRVGGDTAAVEVAFGRLTPDPEPSWRFERGGWRLAQEGEAPSENALLESWGSGGKLVLHKTKINGPADVFATLIPGAEASAAKPGLAAIAGGWQDENTYWLAGAYYWREVPQGETEEQVKVKYVITRVTENETTGEPVFTELEVATEAVFLGEDVDRLELKLKLRGDKLHLYVKNGANWDLVLDADSGAASFGDDYRAGLYHDRPDEATAASCRFDDFKLTTWAAALSSAFVYDTNNPYLLNRHTKPDGSYVDYGYDANGDMTSMQRRASGGALLEDWGYQYSDDRYVKKVTLGGVTKREYERQGDSYMVRRDFTAGSEKRYVRDGDSVLVELNDSNQVTATYFGGGMDKMLSETRGGVTKWNLAGPGGSVMAVADVSGDIVSRYRYDAFGKRNAASSGIDPVAGQRTFQGRPHDEGLGLTNFRNRWYDPETGRFAQFDRVEDGGSWGNPFNFVDADPVNNTDPLGDWDLKGMLKEFKKYSMARRGYSWRWWLKLKGQGWQVGMSLRTNETRLDKKRKIIWLKVRMPGASQELGNKDAARIMHGLFNKTATDKEKKAIREESDRMAMAKGVSTLSIHWGAGMHRTAAFLHAYWRSGQGGTVRLPKKW